MDWKCGSPALQVRNPEFKSQSLKKKVWMGAWGGMGWDGMGWDGWMDR
jgi:hypothetical protein